MTRYFAACTLPVIAVFLSITVFIQSRPYVNHELQRLLVSEDCLPPCFLGIRPGVTTGEDALHVVQTHPWIGDVRVLSSGSKTLKHVDWRWTPGAPAVFHLAPFQTGGFLEVNDDLVQYVSLVTRIQLGDIWLTWGRPDEYQFQTTQESSGYSDVVWYVGIYYNSGFWFYGGDTCSYFPELWRNTVSIFLGDVYKVRFSENRRFDDALPAVVARFDHQMCGQ